MSIISDALKKVEGNSGPAAPMKREAPQVELTEGFSRSSTPPLFSVWSIVLSTVMILMAAVLLFVTWYMNRGRRASDAMVQTAPISSPVDVVPAQVFEMPEAAEPSVAEPAEPGAALQSEAESEPPEEAAPVEAAEPVEPEPAAEPAPAVAGTEPPEPEPAPAPAAVASTEAAAPPAPKPEPAASRKRDELVLTGVVYTPRVRMAHINGKILPEGAEIRGYRIVTISRESVRLSKNDKFYILRLKR